MINAFIDRIENDRAVCIARHDEDAMQFDLPVGLLPVESAPGDHLIITIERAPDETSATLQTIQEIKAELTQASDPGQLNFKL